MPRSFLITLSEWPFMMVLAQITVYTVLFPGFALFLLNVCTSPWPGVMYVCGWLSFSPSRMKAPWRQGFGRLFPFISWGGGSSLAFREFFARGWIYTIGLESNAFFLFLALRYSWEHFPGSVLPAHPISELALKQHAHTYTKNNFKT